MFCIYVHVNVTPACTDHHDTDGLFGYHQCLQGFI